MNTKQAKDFFVDQAAQQAALDRTPLSDLKKRMMYFTESDPASCDDPISLNDEFESQYDTPEYETKMSRLLSHAHKRLKAESPGATMQWNEALSTLEKGDHYVLILLRHASSANERTNDDPGNKVIKYGGMFVAGCFLLAKLSDDRRIPTWVFECFGILLFVIFFLTMFFLVQQEYRALRRRRSPRATNS